MATLVEAGVENIHLSKGAAATGFSTGKKGDLVDREATILGKGFTVGWLLDSLRENDEVYKEKHGHRTIKKIDQIDVSGGKGFVSIVVRCTLHFTDSVDQNDVYTTILKIPGMESLDEVMNKSSAGFELEDKFIHNLVRFHKFECEFYEHLAPRLQIPAPKVYKTAPWVYKKTDGCLHMEDLSMRAKSLTYFDSVTLSHVWEVTRHLAKMHKQVLCFEDKSWRGMFMDNQVAFTEGTEQFRNFLEPFLKLLKAGQQEQVRAYYEKYEKLALNPDFVRYINCDSYKDLGLEPVIVHGDMHSGNIMWKVSEYGETTHEVGAFVDFQIMHEGSPMSDLARFMTLCADGSVRREAELTVFDFYHKILTQELASVGRQNPYTVDKLRQAYDICQMGQSFHTWIMAVFLKDTLPKEEKFAQVNQAKLDKGALRALHSWEDMDMKLSGEYKYLLERFGQ